MSEIRRDDPIYTQQLDQLNATWRDLKFEFSKLKFWQVFLKMK